MENEMKKANQEKSQMSMLINTLQKEITAKDMLVRKAKAETERCRVEIRNKDLELSSLAGKVC